MATCRKDWVHETGLDIDNRQAVMISGIYMSDTFYDTNTVGTYAYKLDYEIVELYLIIDSLLI